MSLKINAAVYSHIGGRHNNEDNFFFNGIFMNRQQMNKGGEYHAVSTENSQIYAVCDGMGGAEFGEEASLLTVMELKKYQKECQQPDSSVHLNKMIDEVSRKVDDISLSKGMMSGSCGSTIAMLIVNEYYFRTVHVGDSRIYRLRNGQLERLTKDHSEVQRMLDNGQITQEQAWRHPRGNVITKHLGMPLNEGEQLHPTIGQRMDLMPGDRFLIASDGLTDVVPDQYIQKLLQEHMPTQKVPELLVKTALEGADFYGIPSDNVTVIVIDVLDIGKRQIVARRRKLMRVVQWASGLVSAASLAGIGYLCYLLFSQG